MIVDFQEYRKSCYNHLLSSMPSNDEAPKLYYIHVNEFALEDAKTKILEVLNEALETKIISKEEFTQMNPEGKYPAKFYCHCKVHKANSDNTVPPVITTISGSGSITENIIIHLDYHIKDLASKHSTYLQDTPHFL